MAPDFSKIKLIIWDLDETFWKGVLSEGDVFIPDAHIQLVHDLLDAGVMCSICSKNEPEEVKKQLTASKLDNLFVFQSINWSAKGKRIRQIIDEMGLRAANVLFLDDNSLNLKEAEADCPGIMTGDAALIPSLCLYFRETEKKDREHKRLKQYQILENKQVFKAKTGNNEEFLLGCHIQVKLWHDCENHVDRICELIARTNQLNFTKKRISKEELLQLFHNPAVETGYVTVTDDFGDYGIIGFYAKQEDELLHFLFSCRTLNMGVEQFVYHMIGRPRLEIVPEVVSDPREGIPNWINQPDRIEEKEKKSYKQLLNGKILIKGPCDMEQMFSFIEPSPNIITEFTYVNDAGVSIEHYNHTTQIINTKILSKKDKARLCALPFCDRKMYTSAIFDEDVSIVMLSLFNDPHLGVYREKETGILMAFGEYLNDLTDDNKWEDYVNGTLFTAKHRFTIEELKQFKKQFDYLGRLSPDEVLANLKWIFDRLNKNAIFILCLGSEMNIEEEAYLRHESYIDRHLYHKELNRLVREWANSNDRIQYIDVNDYVASRDDFLDTINHMKKNVYYGMSSEFVKIVNSVSDRKLSNAEHMNPTEKQVGFVQHFKRRIRYILFHEK